MKRTIIITAILGLLIIGSSATGAAYIAYRLAKAETTVDMLNRSVPATQVAEIDPFKPRHDTKAGGIYNGY